LLKLPMMKEREIAEKRARREKINRKIAEKDKKRNKKENDKQLGLFDLYENDEKS
jgi:hypothetical protein